MTQNKKNILIIGAGIAGNLLAEDIRKNYPDHHVLGFIDDAFKKSKNVIGDIVSLPNIIDTYKIQEIIVAIPSLKGELLRKILLTNLNNRVPINIVPRDQEIIRKKQVRYADVKQIDFEDFLGRSIVQTSVDKLSAFYKDKTVLITGGAGSIGSEIVRQLIGLGVKMALIYDNSEYSVFTFHQELINKNIPNAKYKFVIGNICDQNRLSSVFRRFRPDIVFHAAAYKHVYLMEDNPSEAFTNNVLGTMNVANLSVESGVKMFTFISTDKVVNPRSIMGITKKMGEIYVNSIQSKQTKFNIVRFGNVINSNGSVLPLFEKQIAERMPLTVTDKKMKRFFMSIREAANLVIESAANGSRSNTYVLNMGELINIYEVALCLIRSKNLLVNSDVPIKIIGRKNGEKIVEELFSEYESNNLKKTNNPKIWALRKQEQIFSDIHEKINRARGLVAENKEKKLKSYLSDVFAKTQKNTITTRK